VLRIRLFVAYLLTTAFSGFSMMAYVANSSYVLQVMKGVDPMPFALFFASTALSQVLLSLVNARLVGRIRPRTLIGFGLTMSTTAVIMLSAGVLFLGTPLLLTCAGFLILMAAQAFVFGNSGALAAGQATHIAGSASAALGVAMALAGAIAAPLASSGGGETAVPMVIVMIVGATCSVLAFLFLTRSIGPQPASSRADARQEPDRQ
jgi:DHA1 family bicyclomycin/chloramphenicol resistance-like MFS transporter